EADDGGRDGESGREDEGPEPMALYAAGEGDRQQRQHAGRQRRERAGGEAEEAGAHAAAPARLERARKERADLAGIGAERRAAALGLAVEGDEAASDVDARIRTRTLSTERIRNVAPPPRAQRTMSA